ncbi:MAG: site-specific DNA-methyltransferase, partial [Lentimicrobiaceae bacterium]|nr:site-specific DNA-methyltransferase [Lentimicrobiaceae bacterium]
MELNHIYTGDALKVLKSLPSESVDCIVTSPPYYCLRDYGVSGQIGLEQSPEQYIKRLEKVFIACKRVLKKSGTMWVVIGDSYAGSGRGIGDVNKKGIQPKASFATEFSKPKSLPNCKNKDLIGIPWMLAFALRKTGWYLRQDIIWNKPNPMPESVRDRCTKAHEYVFLFAKSPKYYFNQILEPACYDGRKACKHSGSTKCQNNASGLITQNISKGGAERWANRIEGIPARNRRSVWTVPTKGFKGAHFATFPPDLIRTCIEAGCPPDGVVLDPFMGAGTTAVVAKELGRNYVGIELNREYVRIA